MNIVILHHHLNPGGVTQAIANHVRALDVASRNRRELRIVVLHGDGRDGWPDDSLCSHLPQPSVNIVPELGYDTGTTATPVRLARQILQRLRALDCGPDDTVIHAHNHSLGKNISFPGALVRLSREGYPLLLQVHDFVEDFRPDEYRRLIAALCPGRPSNLPATLYPQARNIHYAVLNRRDHCILGNAGVPAERLYLLPNPVANFAHLPERTPARRKLQERFGVPESRGYILYPVRCIRRKNIGEALLWSLLARDKAMLGFTLPPLNPLEQPLYGWWKRVASELGLPCVFETGVSSGFSFGENLVSADRILNTSVAEGFGMVFLEAWLAGRDLIGRDLPEITADFTTAGIRLTDMHPQLQIPIDWIGAAAFRAAFEGAYRSALARYNRPLPSQHDLRVHVEDLEQDGRVDFARLTAALQGRVLEVVRRHNDHIDRLLVENPWIVDALEGNANSASVAQNAAVVREHYSSRRCGAHLVDVYDSVLASARDDVIQVLGNRGHILDAFQALNRFYPIRTENHG